jgi:NADPH:quinone reductase-like Zn-dependent oxidoreductase
MFMKAAICTRYGPPEVLVVREVEKPRPRDDEVLVRIHASSVNSSDCFIRSGLPDASVFTRVMMKLMIGLRRPRRQIPRPPWERATTSSSPRSASARRPRCGPPASALQPGGRVLSVEEGTPEQSVRDLAELERLAESGALKPVIDRRYPLAQIAEV